MKIKNVSMFMGGTLMAVALSIPAVAAEEKWKTSVVKDRPGPVAIDPTKAYILVKADYSVNPSFKKIPDEMEAKAHSDERAEALVKEHAKWEKKYASWQSSGSTSEAPLEPTDENFIYPTYEEGHSFSVGPQNRFNKKKAPFICRKYHRATIYFTVSPCSAHA